MSETVHPALTERTRLPNVWDAAAILCVVGVLIGVAHEAQGTFERLRAWRAAAAKEQGVPAYVIFHDATLREIAVQGPASLAELARVNGVGEAKLAKYGQQILDLLSSPSDAASAP